MIFVMALRILMIGDDYTYLKTDEQMLRERGFRVYLCDDQNIATDMIGETKPDVVFINSQKPHKSATDIYHKILDNILYASLPVIFTLLEDDVYLVNRKRTAVREHRCSISDNIVDAIKTALMQSLSLEHGKIHTQNPFRRNDAARRA